MLHLIHLIQARQGSRSNRAVTVLFFLSAAALALGAFLLLP